MNNDQPVVRFESVGKRFVFTKEQPRSFLETFISFFSRNKRNHQQNLWALRDVSFDVMPGQGIGFIGRNGSGKSTILKLISQIIRPNEGRITVRGRISALLELGAGFHPDLTGRENIFLNAAVLGLKEAEVNALYDQIVDFSELSEFIDMPVKHYSSGMFMRLGFSVAIHIQPDILIVDEILAVGDQAFQIKCIDAIMEMKRRGTTIIIVSHNLNMIQTLCTHLVWIEKGEVRSLGTTKDVAAQYMEYSYEQEGKVTAVVHFDRHGDQVVEITAVTFLNAAGEEQQQFQTGDEMIIEMAYFAHKPIPNPEFGLAIYRQDGVHINGPNSQLAGLDLGMIEGEGKVRYHIKHLSLLPAQYLVTAAVHDSRYPHCYDYHKDAYIFRITPGGTNEIWGTIALMASWESM